MTTMDISATEMHKKVGPMGHSAIANKFNLNYEDNDMEIELLYVTNLLMRGELDQVREYFHSFTDYYAQELLHTTSYYTYFGTLLHILLYWNDSDDAFELYKFFRNKGALPIKDYYEQYPYEQDGTLYIAHQNGDGDYKRNHEDFTSLYEKVKKFEDGL